MATSICLTPQSCAMSLLDSIWGGLANAVREAAGNAVTVLFSWWTRTPSASVGSAVTHTAQHFVTAWVALPIAVLAVLAAVTWSVGTGGPSWLHDLGRGLLVFGIVAAGSIPIVAAVQGWMDEVSSGLLGAVPTRDVGDRLISALSLPGVNLVQVAFWSLLVFVLSLVQFIVMLFRDGAVLVLTVVLPIAAAGQFSRGSMLWLPRVVGWLLAFLSFKPAAALIYYIGFSLVGQGNDVATVASGLCVMFTSLVALPALLRLVSFAVTSPNPSGSALSTAATASGVATSVTQIVRSGGRSGATAGSAPQGAVVVGSAPPAVAAVAAAGATRTARTGAASAVTPSGTAQP